MQLLPYAIRASIKAGHEILNIYRQDDFEIQLKSDNSPLTIADKKAHHAIVEELKQLPIPILSEEGTQYDFSVRKEWEKCWIVDPLDGTKEFIHRNDEFTVNIALIDKGIPVLGVIYIPVSGMLYFAEKKLGAYRINTNDITNFVLDDILSLSVKLPLKKESDVLRVVGSRSHMNEETRQFIDRLKQESKAIEIVSKGSSLKLCLIAEGNADIYPRFSPTMEWDIAAGHAIILAAGGTVKNACTKQELIYNKSNLLNPHFIATL